MDPGTNRGHAAGPFRLDGCRDLTSLGRILQDAGFDEPAVARTVQWDNAGRPVDVPAILRRTEEPSPYHTLVRLFVLARTVSPQAARDALTPLPLEELAEVGLLEPDGDGVRSQAALLPADDLLLVRDFWPQFTEGPTPRDYVLGVGPASRTVVNMTVRRQAGNALDLGTGAGILALSAAAHSDRVIATDTNPRALNFAALNARLNKIANIEFRAGTTYEPVSDCRFDLIMSNPPFVISPRSQFEYRDSGLSGDAISEQVIRGAPSRMREGAYCTVLFNWHHQTEQDWADRPTEWLRSCGCDAWILCKNQADPISYASSWLRNATGDVGQSSAQRLDEWLTYYEQLGIGRISTGVVVLRHRSGGPNWIRAEEAPDGQPEGSCGDQIQRVFAAEDLLAGMADPRELLGRTLRLTPEHQLEHVMQAENGQWTVQLAQLRQTRGFPFVGNVDRLLSTVLAGCDGRHTLGELVADLASGLQMDVDEVAPACISVMQTLLRSGFFLTEP